MILGHNGTHIRATNELISQYECGLGTVKFLKFGRRHLQRCDPNEKSGCSSTRRWELAVFIVLAWDT